MYCECLACTKEKIELWAIQYGYFKLNDSCKNDMYEASSSSDEPVDWSEELPHKKVPNQVPFYRIRSPFEDMNGHYKALNLNSLSRDNEVKNTQDVMELVTAKLVENYQRSQNIENSVGSLDMLQDPTI